MSTFIKNLVAKKIKQLSHEELLHYSKEYGLSLSPTEAENITTFLKTQEIDPFDVNDRFKMFKELAQITNPDTAKKAQQIFTELIKSYGVEHLFD